MSKEASNNRSPKESTRLQESTYGLILKRLDQETSYLTEVKQLGMLDVLSNLSGSHTINGSQLRWHVFNFLYFMVDTSPDRKPHGNFDPAGQRVNIFFKRPSIQEMLDSMSREYVPEAIKGMFHEGMHAFQFSQPTTKSEAVSQSRKKGALMESQAFRFTLDHNLDRIIPTDEFTRYVLGFYGGRHREIQIISACKTIDQLHALGLSHLEIANLIQEEEGWDEESSSFPHIFASVEARKKARGTSSWQLDELVILDANSKEIERDKAIAIIKEELQK